MSVPENEMKSAFDLASCPERLLALFQSAMDPKCDTLNLSYKHINNIEEIAYILSFLSAYPHIKTLDLSRNALNADILNALGGNTTLYTLNLSQTSLDYDALFKADVFRHNTTIKHLDFSANKLNKDKPGTAAALERASECASLMGQIGEDAQKSDYYVRLKTFIETTLGTHLINEPKKDGATLFADMALESLNLSHTPIQGVGSLATSRTLRSVDISYHQIPEADILRLASNPSIRSLNLAFCNLDISFLSRLAAVNPSLSALDCSGIKAKQDLSTPSEAKTYKDAAFSALAQMPCLQSLTMNHASVSDGDLMELAKNKAIRVLSLEGNFVMDLSCLKGTNITHLNLKNNHLGDCEPYNAAAILVEMPQLTALNVEENRQRDDVLGIDYEGAKLLLDKSAQKTKPVFSTIRLPLLMGTHLIVGANSPVYAFVRSQNCDRKNIFKLIFSFFGSPAFELKHDFVPRIMKRYAENKRQLEAQEIQAAANGQMEQVIAQSLKETHRHNAAEEANFAHALAESQAIALEAMNQHYVVFHQPISIASSSPAVHAVQPTPRAAAIPESKVSVEQNNADAQMKQAILLSQQVRTTAQREEDELARVLALSLQDTRKVDPRKATEEDELQLALAISLSLSESEVRIKFP